MTIDEILLNDNIRSDRYAMAAISFIFNAFGDSVRSKEYWPWSEKVNCEWPKTKGTEIDISYAQLFLDRALNKYNDEIENNKINLNNDSMDNTFKNDIRSLKKRINKVKFNTKTIIKSTNELNNISDNTTQNIEKITA